MDSQEDPRKSTFVQENGDSDSENQEEFSSSNHGLQTEDSVMNSYEEIPRPVLKHKLDCLLEEDEDVDYPTPRLITGLPEPITIDDHTDNSKPNNPVISSLKGVCLLVQTIYGANNWDAWKYKYEKVYSNTKEELYRRTIWQKNFLNVRKHNEKSDKQFLLHMNQFADSDTHIRDRNAKSQSVKREINAPTSFDWRSKGVIGPVHDQGRLFNVKAIVASECVASLQAIQTGHLYDLSAYEIDDCGCGMQLFIKDIFGCIKRKIGGLCTNVTYHHQDEICNKDTCTPVAMVNGTGFIPEGDEDAMLAAILETPLMVAIDASQPSFELYQSGIYSDAKCSPDHLSHIMQVVGYGEQNGRKYWICRNSWGREWGNQGYVWVERGTNMCGIASFAIYPY